MFYSAIAQLRLAASIGMGRRFAQWSLDAAINGMLAARREFGGFEPDEVELLTGPVLDIETRAELQLRRFRAQARSAEGTTHYRRLFTDLGLELKRLSHEEIRRIPTTSQAALRADPGGFVHPRAAPCFRTTTTGTTGPPTSVYFSAYEIRTYIALACMTFLMTGGMDESDIVQVSASSRATLGNVCFAGACARLGAVVFQGGLVAPEASLALLAERHSIPGKKRQVSYLNTYPSYLGTLVERGLELGYRPADFGLETIVIGGELVSAGVRRRAQDLFGPVQIVESYGMTETWPMTGQRCSAGHLHFEPGQGLVEVLDVETGEPAWPGRLGTIVATPFPPYRETTIVLRYDTQDLVYPLEGEPGCELSALPAVGRLQGKRRLAVRHSEGWTVPRDILEALEGLDVVPLPARYGMRAVQGGVAVEVVVRRADAASRRAIEGALEEAGVPLRDLRVVEDPGELERPLPLRCDLVEVGFAGPSDIPAMRLPATDGAVHGER